MADDLSFKERERAEVPIRELRRESWMLMGWAAPHGLPYWSVKLTPVVRSAW